MLVCSLECVLAAFDKVVNLASCCQMCDVWLACVFPAICVEIRSLALLQVVTSAGLEPWVLAYTRTNCPRMNSL